MRKIFPLKPAAAGANDTSTSSSRKGTPVKSRRSSSSSFLDKVDLGDVVVAGAAVAPPPLSGSGNCFHGQDVSGEPVARVKREHWCPACAAPGTDANCGTPPSGDENLATLEEIKTLVVAKNEAAELSFLHRHGLHVDSSFGHNASTAFSSSSSAKGVLISLPRASSNGRRHGVPLAPLGEHPRTAPAPAPARPAEVVSMSARNDSKSDKRSTRSRMLPSAFRSSSAPKTRLSASSASQLSEQSSARHSSMRYLEVPDRVYSTADASPEEKAQLSSDPLERPSGRQERSATTLRSRGQSRQSGDEAVAVSEGDATRALHARSLSESEWLPSPSVSPKISSSKLRSGSRASSNNEKPQSRYLSARTVAERLARAIRGSTRSWSKDVKAFVPPSQGPENTRRADEADASPVSRIQGVEDSPSTSTTDSTLKAPSGTSDGAGHSLPDSVQEIEEHMLQVQLDPKDSQEWHDSSTDSKGGRSQTPESCGSKTGVERTALLAELGKSLEAQLDNRRHWPADSLPPSRSSWPLSLLQDEASRMSPRLASRDEQIGRHTPAGHPDEFNQLTPRLVTVHPDESPKQTFRQTSEPMGEDLDSRFRAAQEQVSMLAGEKALLEDQFDLLTEDSMEWRLKMQQRLRRMHEEKKHLAQEVAAEVKRRMTERVAAKEVLGMMKKEMESCMNLMEKEKFDTQINLEQELERRETTWGSRMEKIQAEEGWLRDRLKSLEEEKGGLQQELATVNSKENALREKVSEFENQMDAHRKRVEGAEKTILDLRNSLDESFKHSRQTESDLELLRKACKEKDGENSDLRKLVQRLQQLCQDHEKSIHGLRQAMKNASDRPDDADGRVRRLQKELIRLSGVEQALRSELEASRGESTVLRRDNKGLLERLRCEQREAAVQMKKFETDHRTEVDRLQSQIVELGQDNNILAGKLRVVLREREEAKDALKVSESCMKGVEEQNRSLQEDLRRERTRIQDMQQDFQDVSRLEKRAESLAKHNQMLQALLAIKEKAVLASGEEVKEKEHQVREAQHTQSEMRQSLQVSARQLYIMNERVEIMASKLQERESQIVSARKECEQREEVIRGLEQNLSELARQVDSQNARIQRLTGNNEELFRLYHEKGREIEELQHKLLQEIEGKLECEQQIEQLKETIKDLKNEVKSQELNCKVLRDKLFSREADIEENNKEVSLLVQRRDWLQNELQQCKKLHSDAARKVELLDHQVKELEGQLAASQTEAESRSKELSTLREELPVITKERDSMQQEAEEMGREALRMSAEVEVLRRKVQQLDEDVMVKEGQISILRGNYEVA